MLNALTADRKTSRTRAPRRTSLEIRARAVVTL